MTDGTPVDAATVAAVVDAWFDGQHELEVERETYDGRARTWFTVLRGERKRTIPVYLELGSRHLLVESFFMQAPDENAAEVYTHLLRRNLRTYLLRFALHESGDVLLVGLLPLAAVTPEEVDRLLGQLLLAADETFDVALRLGFASYIEREQAWRARVGAPRNPIS
jgi:hypothetical protein